MHFIRIRSFLNILFEDGNDGVFKLIGQREMQPVTEGCHPECPPLSLQPGIVMCQIWLFFSKKVRNVDLCKIWSLKKKKRIILRRSNKTHMQTRYHLCTHQLEIKVVSAHFSSLTLNCSGPEKCTHTSPCAWTPPCFGSPYTDPLTHPSLPSLPASFPSFKDLPRLCQLFPILNINLS